MAENLGLKDATTAPLCLACHTDFVPEARRGKDFKLADGVGCEACHGGSERWLSLHTVQGTERAALVDAGMYPTWDPAARGAMCLSCHLGDEQKFATHALYGAGHPRLSFELDTFTAVQPAHFTVDADYRARKPTYSHAQIWAQGQVAASLALLDAMGRMENDDENRHPATLPAAVELAFYDCQACHHPLTKPRWVPRAGVGLGPGVARVRDEHLVMLRSLAMVVSPALSEALTREGVALQKAAQGFSRQDASAVQALRATVRKLGVQLTEKPLTAAQTLPVLKTLAQGGADGRFTDYAAAEQAVMAMSALLDTLEEEKKLTAAQHQALTRAIDGCYDALSSYENWSAGRFAESLSKVAALL